MRQEDVKSLLEEVVESQGFINLDQNDINKLQDGVDSVDALKVNGSFEQVGGLLHRAISTLRNDNREKSIHKLLFAIRLPSDNNFTMENMSKIHEVLDMLGDEIDCVWGLSTHEDLEVGTLEIIVVVGLS